MSQSWSVQFVEWTCACFNTLAVLMLIGGLITICRRGIKLERTMKLVIVVLGIGLLYRFVYNYMVIFIDYDSDSDNMKFILWDLAMKS